LTQERKPLSEIVVWSMLKETSNKIKLRCLFDYQSVSEPICEQADLQRVHADTHLCLVHAAMTDVCDVSGPLGEQADLQGVHANRHLCLVHAA
ncbi:MAG: hypothetical protein ACK56F_14325, partial [bacterium]